MNIRLLNKKTELDKIREWIPFTVFENDFPGHTFCVVDGDEIISVGSIRLMEGDICYMDSIATNPSFSREKRNEALNILSKKLFECAKSLGFKRMFGSTRDESLKKRAEELGFREAKQTLYIREL
jgi:hypothetical protein